MNACPVCRCEVQKGQPTCSFCRLNFTQWELANASKVFSAQTAWSTPPCPKCGKYFTKRIVEEDAADTTATLRGLLSYRCQLCTKLFRATSPVPKEKPASEPETATRRQYVRVPVNFPARLWTGQNTPPIAATVVEMAMGGCSLDVEAALDQGAQLKIELSVPERVTPVVIRTAMVCSTRPKGFGLEFTDLQAEEKILLGRIMEELLASAIMDCQRAINQ